ncbi:hypothetical protein EXIGLDRAFT_708876 [Exidia glandulosa HHB12029]|uniref:Uncharacterized protein n=1 Tax=Exidia glandulosa HHB12029 TaxID=1314781 RepID=A0A165J4M8_EXIGL|nr:hypothetical protein EXIGLDRAFT_708876 [Exidia glandulosa HHB12029]
MSGKMFSSKIGILPKLQVGGTNWMTYRNLMEQYLARKNTLQDLKPNTEETLALEWWKKDIAKYKLDDDTYQDLVNEWLKKENTIMSAMNQSLPADIHQHLLTHSNVFEIWAAGENDEDVLNIIWVTIGKHNEYLTAGGPDLCCNTHQEYAKAVLHHHPHRYHHVKWQALVQGYPQRAMQGHPFGSGGRAVQVAVVQRVKDPRPQVRPKNLRRKGKAKASASSAKGITNQTTGAADTSDGSSNGDQEHYSILTASVGHTL